MTLELEWDRATTHPLDGETQRLEVPFPPDEITESVRTSLASALVGLEVVGGPIETAKLGHDHIRLELSADADIETVKPSLEELVERVSSSADGTGL